MNFFSDLKAINKVVLKKSNQAYIKNLILIPLFAFYIAAYSIAFIILVLTVGRLGAGGAFLASIITWFLSCYMISDFMEHIDNALIGRKIRMKDIGSSYMRYFRPLLTATAVPRIVVYLFSALTKINIPGELIILFYIVYAIPEIVYQKEVDRLDMFTYGHRFLKENWQHWAIINSVLGVVLLGAGYGVGFIVTPVLIAIGNILPNADASRIVLLVLQQVMVWALLGIPYMYFFIYRGFIFKILSVSSRRKREYMRNIYGNR